MKRDINIKKILLILLCISLIVCLPIIIKNTVKINTIDNAKLKIVSLKVLHKGESVVQHNIFSKKNYVKYPEELEEYETILEYKGTQFVFDDWNTYSKCCKLILFKGYIRGKVIEKEYFNGKKSIRIESLYFN